MIFAKQIHQWLSVPNPVISQCGNYCHNVDYLPAGHKILYPTAKSISSLEEGACIIYLCMPSIYWNICHIEGAQEMCSELMNKGTKC